MMAVALKMFFRITARWGLGEKEQIVLLGNPVRSTSCHWKKNMKGYLTDDTIERISYIVGIYKSLHILLPNEHRANSWVKNPNKIQLFNGRSALDKMIEGKVSDLYVVDQYLRANCEGWS